VDSGKNVDRQRIKRLKQAENSVDFLTAVDHEEAFWAECDLPRLNSHFWAN
jgi:hypothetical protein